MKPTGEEFTLTLRDVGNGRVLDQRLRRALKSLKRAYSLQCTYIVSTDGRQVDPDGADEPEDAPTFVSDR